jgi:hypothetical protein
MTQLFSVSRFCPEFIWMESGDQKNPYPGLPAGE